MRVVFRVTKNAPLIAVNFGLLMLLAALLYSLWHLEQMARALEQLAR